LSTEQCVPHDSCICIYAGLHTCVYHTTALYVSILANRPVCTTLHMDMCILRSTDQCVSWTCIYTGLQTSIYHMTAVYVYIQAYRSVCTTQQLYMYLSWPTDQCVPRDSCISIYAGLQTRALCRIKLLPVTCFGGHMDVNC